MTFNITRDAKLEGKESIYVVDCPQPGKLAAGVIKALSARPSPHDLHLTLVIVKSALHGMILTDHLSRRLSSPILILGHSNVKNVTDYLTSTANFLLSAS